MKQSTKRLAGSFSPLLLFALAFTRTWAAPGREGRRQADQLAVFDSNSTISALAAHCARARGDGGCGASRAGASSSRNPAVRTRRYEQSSDENLRRIGCANQRLRQRSPAARADMSFPRFFRKIR